MVAIRSGHGHDLYQAWMVLTLGRLGGGRTSTRRVWCGLLLLMLMLLPVLMLLDGLNPGGDRGSHRARYRVGGNRTAGRGESKKSRRVTMFWGPGWEMELYVVWRGGARGSADTVQTRGSRGNAVGWQEGRMVTMLAAGRNCCV